MEFEDIQRIWHTQEEAPMYAINQETLFKQLRKKSRSTESALNFFEAAIIVSSIFSIIMLYINWADNNVPWTYYLIPGMLLVISAYIALLRYRRKRNAHRYGQSLMDELEKAIAHNQFLLERARTMIWWYILPVFGGFMIYFYVEQGPYWWQSILSMIGVGILAIWGARWEIRKWHEPRQRDLEALRKLLTENREFDGSSPIHE